MAHCMKHTKASCGHMFAHFDRKAEHISNENVDRTRSHLNYNLAAHQQMEQGEFVRQRCSEVRCQNRKDVNVMVSWIVTAPKDLPQQAEPAFFQAAYDFLESRYGRSNVVSAYVHMDEVTPHMHFAFVPVTEDRKRGGCKVSAKEVINRRDLQTFHADLSKYLEQQLGFPVNVLNEATKEGNRSIEQLKRQSATEQIAAAAVEASQIVSKAREQAAGIEGAYKAQKAFVERCEAISNPSNAYPDWVQEKKHIFGEPTVTLPKEKWEAFHVASHASDCVASAVQMLDAVMSDFKRSTATESIISELKSQIQQLKSENKQLKNENSQLKDDNRALEWHLKQEKENTSKIVTKNRTAVINDMYNIADHLPAESGRIFYQELDKLRRGVGDYAYRRTQKQPKRRVDDMER